MLSPKLKLKTKLKPLQINMKPYPQYVMIFLLKLQANVSNDVAKGSKPSMKFEGNTLTQMRRMTIQRFWREFNIVGLIKIPLLYKVHPLEKSDSHGDVTGFGSNMVANKQDVYGFDDTFSVRNVLY